MDERENLERESENGNKDKKASKGREGLRLTDRDYDLFSFLLDQKFSSLEALYFRFFDGRQSAREPLPRNLFVARQRLGMLKRAGLLKTQKVYSEAKSLYLLSAAGFHALRGKRDIDCYAPPIKEVDFRNYEHDTAVTYCRVAIERQHKAMKWYCERRLRMEGFSGSGARRELPEAVVPDGIFISSKGERIVFELEYTQRKKSRYESKVREYERVMWGHDPLIHKVLFVGGNERVYRDLGEVLQGHKNFLLESYGHFLGRLFPPIGATEVAQKLRDPRMVENGRQTLTEGRP